MGNRELCVNASCARRSVTREGVNAMGGIRIPRGGSHRFDASPVLPMRGASHYEEYIAAHPGLGPGPLSTAILHSTTETVTTIVPAQPL